MVEGRSGSVKRISDVGSANLLLVAPANPLRIPCTGVYSNTLPSVDDSDYET